MADKNRCFLYARKSTDVEDKQVRSIDAQLTELAEFARRSSIEITETIIEKESAKAPGRRKQFNAMLDRIERGEAEGILAWHPDRLARNMSDGGRIIDLIDTGKLTLLRFPTFWFESTPQGKFMLAMAFSQSKYYVDALSENTKRGLREKVRRGEYPSNAPIGYLNDRLTKRIIVDRERAPLVQEAFTRYATGTQTLDDIRQFFAENSIRSKSGKLLIRPTITGMFKNPFYYGQFRYAGDISDGIHEPLISKALFDTVQAVFADRFRYNPKVRARVPKPLTGLMRCGECGGMITAETQKGHTYYRCTKKSKLVRCSQPFVREEALDAEITRLLRPHGLREDWADAMLARLESETRDERATATNLIARKRQQIEAITPKIHRLQEMRIEGELDAAGYMQRKARFMGLKKTLEEEIVEIAKGRQPWLEPFKDWILTARNLINIAETGSLIEKRGVAKKVFGSNLFLSGRKGRGIAIKPWADFADNELSHDVVSLYNAARTFFMQMPAPEPPRPSVFSSEPGSDALPPCGHQGLS